MVVSVLVDITWTMVIKSFSSFINRTLRFKIYIRFVNSITLIVIGPAFALSVSTQHGLLLGKQDSLRPPSLRRSLFIIEDLYRQCYVYTRISDFYKSTLFSSAE